MKVTAITTGKHTQRLNEMQEQRMEDGIPPDGTLVPRRRLDNAHRAIYAFLQSLRVLEAIIDRPNSELVATAAGFDLLSLGNSVDIRRAMARVAYKNCKYWETWARKYTVISHEENVHRARLYNDFHQFAGNPDDCDVCLTATGESALATH